MQPDTKDDIILETVTIYTSIDVCGQSVSQTVALIRLLAESVFGHPVYLINRGMSGKVRV